MTVREVDKTTVIVVQRLERAAGNSQEQNDDNPVRTNTDTVEGDRGNARVLGVDWPNLPRKPDGSYYLVDLCPTITGTTSRRELTANDSWQHLRDTNQVEWRCWKLIQAWKRFAHWTRRYKLKKKLWHHLGEMLQMVKRRSEEKEHFLERGMPPSTLRDDGSRERWYPNAKMGLDRQAPRAASSSDPQGSIVSRHRILH